MKSECRSLVDALRLMSSPECVSISRYNLDSISSSRFVRDDRVNFMVDYASPELRVCVEVYLGSRSTIIKVQERTGYNKDRHAWEVEGRSYESTRDNRQGQKKVLDWLDDFYRARSSYNSQGRLRNFMTSMVNGKLQVY